MSRVGRRGNILARGLLYCGDNLDILERYLADASVDLVYLDPPFNSAQTYNALLQEKDGTAAASQIKACEDTRPWNMEAETVYNRLTEQPGKVSEGDAGVPDVSGPPRHDGLLRPRRREQGGEWRLLRCSPGELTRFTRQNGALFYAILASTTC